MNWKLFRLQIHHTAELATHSFLKDTHKDLTHIPKLFLTGNRPLHQMKTADLQNIDPRLIGTRRLMMLTPHYLITNRSEECPQADHALLFEYYKISHSPIQGRSHSLEGISPL